MSSRLKEIYQNEMVDALMKKFGYKNVMQVPKLEKVVVNMGVGEAKEFLFTLLFYFHRCFCH
mgnify:CR=1 FL=1